MKVYIGVSCVPFVAVLSSTCTSFPAPPGFTASLYKGVPIIVGPPLENPKCWPISSASNTIIANVHLSPEKSKKPAKKDKVFQKALADLQAIERKKSGASGGNGHSLPQPDHPASVKIPGGGNSEVLSTPLSLSPVVVGIKHFSENNNQVQADLSTSDTNVESQSMRSGSFSSSDSNDKQLASSLSSSVSTTHDVNMHPEPVISEVLAVNSQLFSAAVDDDDEKDDLINNDGGDDDDDGDDNEFLFYFDTADFDLSKAHGLASSSSVNEMSVDNWSSVTKSHTIVDDGELLERLPLPATNKIFSEIPDTGIHSKTSICASSTDSMFDDSCIHRSSHRCSAHGAVEPPVAEELAKSVSRLRGSPRTGSLCSLSACCGAHVTRDLFAAGSILDSVDVNSSSITFQNLLSFDASVMQGSSAVDSVLDSTSGFTFFTPSKPVEKLEALFKKFLKAALNGTTRDLEVQYQLRFLDNEITKALSQQKKEIDTKDNQNDHEGLDEAKLPFLPLAWP
jgi:hypothetical protein